MKSLKETNQDMRPVIAYRERPHPENKLNAIHPGIFDPWMSGVIGDVTMMKWKNHVKRLMDERVTSDYEEVQHLAEVLLAKMLEGKQSPSLLIDAYLGYMRSGVTFSKTLQNRRRRGKRSMEQASDLTKGDVLLKSLILLSLIASFLSFSETRNGSQSAPLIFILSVAAFMMLGLIEFSTMYLAPPVQPKPVQLRVAYLEALLAKDPSYVLSSLADHLYAESAICEIGASTDLRKHPHKEDPDSYEPSALDQQIFWAHLFEDPMRVFRFCARYAPRTISSILANYGVIFTTEQTQEMTHLTQESLELDPGIAANHHNIVCRAYAGECVSPLAKAIAQLAIDSNRKITDLASDNSRHDNLRATALQALSHQPYTPLTTAMLSISDLDQDGLGSNWSMNQLSEILPHALTASMSGDKRHYKGHLMDAVEATNSAWLYFSVIAPHASFFITQYPEEIRGLFRSIWQAYIDNGGDKATIMQPGPVRKSIEAVMAYDAGLMNRYYDYLKQMVYKRFSGLIPTDVATIHALYEHITARLNKRAAKSHNQIGYNIPDDISHQESTSIQQEWSCFESLFITAVAVLNQNLERAKSLKDAIVLREVRLIGTTGPSDYETQRAKMRNLPLEAYYSHEAKVALDQTAALCLALISSMGGLSHRLKESTNEEVVVARNLYKSLQPQLVEFSSSIVKEVSQQRNLSLRVG